MQTRKIKAKQTWAALLMVFFSCGPDEGDQLKHYGPYRLGEAADYVYFKAGSWWIYENTVNGRIDTFRVVKSLREIRTNRDFYGNTVDYEHLGLLMEAGYYFDYWIYDPFQQAAVVDRTGPDKGILELYAFGSTPPDGNLRHNEHHIFKSTNPIFYYPFSTRSNGHSLRFSHMEDSFWQDGVVYDSTAVFKRAPNGRFGFDSVDVSHFYWSKYVGLTKMDVIRSDGRTRWEWKLKKYHVEQ